MVDVFRRYDELPAVLDEVLRCAPLPKYLWLQQGSGTKGRREGTRRRSDRSHGPLFEGGLRPPHRDLMPHRGLPPHWDLMAATSTTFQSPSCFWPAPPAAPTPRCWARARRGLGATEDNRDVGRRTAQRLESGRDGLRAGGHLPLGHIGCGGGELGLERLGALRGHHRHRLVDRQPGRSANVAVASETLRLSVPPRPNRARRYRRAPSSGCSRRSPRRPAWPRRPRQRPAATLERRRRCPP